MSNSDSGKILKSDVNRARVLLIRKNCDMKFKELAQKVFPEDKLNRRYRDFLPPYTISDEVLIAYEEELGITEIEITEYFCKKEGITPSDADMIYENYSIDFPSNDDLLL